MGEQAIIERRGERSRYRQSKLQSMFVVIERTLSLSPTVSLVHQPLGGLVLGDYGSFAMSTAAR